MDEVWREMNLNLGCGTAILEGFINIDKVNLEGVDIVHDLNGIPYPFEDESIDYIQMNDILEHLEKPIDVLMECWRILKVTGKVVLRLVHWSCHYSYGDPQHLWAFSEGYFDFFTGSRRAYYMPHHFKSVEITHHFTKEAQEKYGYNPEDLMEKAKFHVNIIEGMEVTLVK